MESLIKYAEKAFEIPSVVIMTMLAFLFVLKVSKRYFDSKLEDRSSRIRYTIEELKNTDQSKAYLMEQIFSERYKLVINYKEIMYFLRSSRPSLNMQLYQSCSSYFLFSSNGYKLQLSPSRSKFWLRTKGLILGFGYYFFALLTLFLLQALPSIYILNIETFISSYLVLICLIFFAVMCVHAQLKVENAVKLATSIGCFHS